MEVFFISLLYMPIIRNTDLQSILGGTKHYSPHKLKSNKFSNYMLTSHLVKNPIIGIYEDINQVPWENLPEKFVIKSALGTANNHVKCLKWKPKKKKYRDYLHKRLISREQVIKFFKPEFGKIIVEEYLESKIQGKIPWDFKFYIAYDEFLFLRVVDRNGPKRNIAMFDSNLKRISHYDWFHNDVKHLVSKPKFKLPNNIKTMIDKAIEITKFLEIPFTSIDMYSIDGEIYLGELSFEPGPLKYEHIRRKWLNHIGEKIKLKKKKIETTRKES